LNGDISELKEKIEMCSKENSELKEEIEKLKIRQKNYKKEEYIQQISN
jgi:FtsZ-binding cell division protein ZapB